ncbi:hypothetical protein HELRODRAFT_180112 [Helobdella robusta]|uniref:Protein inhibitor of activated STAT n=1 Tax=Helobdella robusta TaxID=6412 RepID=T1FFH4_HELRO|nr:hypothetical protein HELRODRAFT_180112 [Helobdella robusta]ESN94774.1 hypothetical protein HELRODRAFT_180112 [Helobdella robusta]
MADKNELKNMVLMFRVSELQLLLGLTSQSRCGRKTELMQRALNMLDRGVSSHVQNKIKELYQRFVTRGSTSSSSSVLTNHSNPQMTSSVGGGGGVPAVGGGQGRPVSAVHKGLSELLNQQNGTPMAAPVTYPEVRFKHLPFYDVLAELVRPVSLVPRNSSRQQEMKINFCFSEEHLKQISNSRDISPTTNKVDFRVQVQMRFCVLDVSARQPDCFPTTICVKVNGAVAALPNPIPTNKPGAVPKRPSRPVDITQLCRFSTSLSNSISIAWTVEDNRHYCVVIYLVRKLNSQILLERLQKTSILKPEHTKKLISEKLTLESDNDLALTSLRISLICPLGKMRMSIPCRSQTCDHLQCFDSITFLQMNEKKPTWFCPVCDRPAEFNKLIIDGFISEIIRDSNDSTEIELTKDGAWSVTRSEELTTEDKHNNNNNNNNSSNNFSNCNSTANNSSSTGDDNRCLNMDTSNGLYDSHF